MDVISTLKDHLTKHEGLRLFPYKDTVGKTTIGVGRNLDDRGISTAEAMYLLENDINETLIQCGKLQYWTKLDDIRQCVVANMVFNLGITRFLKFKNMNASLQRGEYVRAAHEMRSSLWYEQVKSRGVFLADAMEKGHF